MKSISEIQLHASKIVREAGKIARGWFGRTSILEVKEGFDPVTQADKEIDQFVREKLSQPFPTHGFVTEEDKDKAADSEYVWVLDPIDGTKHFAGEIPLYSICLALKHRGETVLGVVYDPESNQYFEAIEGQSQRNGKPISVSPKTTLDQCLVCVEVPNMESLDAVRERALDWYGPLNRACRRVRILGISGLDLAYCASGGFDAYARLGCPTKEWDVAAGFYIVKQAGGEVRHEPNDLIVAGSTALCDELLEVLND